MDPEDAFEVTDLREAVSAVAVSGRKEVHATETGAPKDSQARPGALPPPCHIPRQESTQESNLHKVKNNCTVIDPKSPYCKVSEAGRSTRRILLNSTIVTPVSP